MVATRDMSPFEAAGFPSSIPGKLERSRTERGWAPGGIDHVAGRLARERSLSRKP
jgi:hypothetical protein